MTNPSTMVPQLSWPDVWGRRLDRHGLSAPVRGRPADAVAAMCGVADPVAPGFGGMWPRWRQAMHLAAHRGALCFGPNRGRKATHTSPQRWLSGFQPASAPDALADLVRRYLYAYGPATPQQFPQWLSAPRRWATQLFDGANRRA